MGLVSGLSLANHSDSESFLVVHALFSQVGCQRGFWEVVGHVSCTHEQGTRFVQPRWMPERILGGGRTCWCLAHVNNVCALFSQDGCQREGFWEVVGHVSCMCEQGTRLVQPRWMLERILRGGRTCWCLAHVNKVHALVSQVGCQRGFWEVVEHVGVSFFSKGQDLLS